MAVLRASLDGAGDMVCRRSSRRGFVLVDKNSRARSRNAVEEGDLAQERVGGDGGNEKQTTAL